MSEESNVTDLNSSATSVVTIACPFCDEQISVNAKKCRHCGETIDVSMRKAEEALRAAKNSTPHVFMNAGGGGGAAGGFVQQLRPYPWFWHLIFSFFSAGLWIPIWILMWLFRNKNVYY